MSTEQVAAPAPEAKEAAPEVKEAQIPAGEAAATEQQLKADVKNAKTPEEKKAAEKMLKKFKLKVDGEEFEEEIDMNDEKEIVKRLQLAKVASKRMSEKANLEKGLEQFIDLIRKDPMKVLSHPDIGVDVKKFAQEIMDRDLEEQKKSPEQKEKEKLEAELKELREKYENDKKAKEQEEFARLQAEQEEKLTNDIQSALSAEKLPASPRAVKYMAEYMAMALEQGIDVTAAQVAPLVKQKMVEDYKELLKLAPDEVLEQFIDKDLESRLQKKRVAAIKKVPETTNAVKEIGKKAADEAPKKKRTITSFLND